MFQPSMTEEKFAADYMKRDDFNFKWSPRYIPPLVEQQLVGEFSVNEKVSPEDYRIYQAVGGDMNQFNSVKNWVNHPWGAEFPSPEGSIFREDDIKEGLKNHRFDYKIMRKPKSVPMPIIKHINPDAITPPIIVTTDWYCDHLEKHLIDYAKSRKLDQMDVMELIIERDSIRDKLGLLDRRKPKDAKRILKLNCRLKDIDSQIEYLESITGKHESIDYGSKFGRVCGRVKNIYNTTTKAIKKGIKKSIETIGNFFNFDDKSWALIGQLAVTAAIGILTNNFTKAAALVFGTII